MDNYEIYEELIRRAEEGSMSAATLFALTVPAMLVDAVCDRVESFISDAEDQGRPVVFAVGVFAALLVWPFGLMSEAWKTVIEFGARYKGII